MFFGFFKKKKIDRCVVEMSHRGNETSDMKSIGRTTDYNESRSETGERGHCFCKSGKTKIECKLREEHLKKVRDAVENLFSVWNGQKRFIRNHFEMRLKWHNFECLFEVNHCDIKLCLYAYELEFKTELPKEKILKDCRMFQKELQDVGDALAKILSDARKDGYSYNIMNGLSGVTIVPAESVLIFME